MWLGLLLACGKAPPYCGDRPDDADCDGIPDATDRCGETPWRSWVDRVGCTEEQAAGCSVTLASPEDGWDAAGSPVTFRWTGDCDVYLLQTSDDPRFLPGSTRTLLRTEARAVQVTGTGEYWRVVGGRTGSSSGFATPPRTIGW